MLFCGDAFHLNKSLKQVRMMLSGRRGFRKMSGIRNVESWKPYNLVSSSLLSKNGFELVFLSDKFVLSKNDMNVRKGYLSD